MPEAEITVNFSGRVVDLLIHFGLGYTSFEAHGVKTDIYKVTRDQIYGRCALVLVATDHWFYFIPSHSTEPSQADIVGTLVTPDTLLLQANQVISLGSLKMWGTWHAFFHRVNE